MKYALSIAAIALSLGLASCNAEPQADGNTATTAETPDTAAAGSDAESDASEEAALSVAVSIDPQAYFVEQIGGDRVQAIVMVPAAANPHTYEPKPDQLRTLAEADAYIQIGIEFEEVWMDRLKSANTDMTLVDSTQGIDKLQMAAHDHAHGDEHAHGDHAHGDEHAHGDHAHGDEHAHGDHAHGDEHAHGDHAHGDEMLVNDPHVWLDPNLVKIQAQHVRDALVELDPDGQAEYDANLASFTEELDRLDQQIREDLADLNTRKFMVFHPSWNYFAAAYDLEQIPVEVGGQEPSAAELADLIATAKAENIRVIFAQPEFSTASAEAIANEIDGEVLLVSPLDRDWANNLLSVSETFASVLGDSAP